MELADYLQALRRRWWMIALALLVCSTGTAVVSFNKAPVYSSATRLLVVPMSGDATGTTDPASRAVTYSQFATTGPAVTAGIDAGHAAGMGVQVTATADGSSPFLIITATAASPNSAQSVAAAYVTMLPQMITTLERSSSRHKAVAPELRTLEAAPLPSKPSSPRPVRDTLIGAALGLILGIAFSLVRESLDARVRESRELEHVSGSTLLGMIPKEFTRERLPAVHRPHSRRSEAYRQVRTNLEFTSSGGMPRSIVVTSPAAGDGKSSLVANLAVVSGRAGRNVVIVDGDLRKPTVMKSFGLESPIGLVDVLEGRWTLDEALQQVPGERLWVLGSGPETPIPSELVGSAAMADLIEELEARFDFVILDAPPVIAVTDALQLGVNVAGVVVVARMRESTRSSIQRAVDSVRKVNANLLGVVGNASTDDADEAYGYGYGYVSRKRIANPEPIPMNPTIRAAGRRLQPEGHAAEQAPTRKARRLAENGFSAAPNRSDEQLVVRLPEVPGLDMTGQQVPAMEMSKHEVPGKVTPGTAVPGLAKSDDTAPQLAVGWIAAPYPENGSHGQNGGGPPLTPRTPRRG